MSEVVSFRADDEELALIESTRRRLGLATRADALRHLIREGAAKSPKFSESRLAKFRLPKRFREGRTLSGDELDDLLYGSPPRRD